MRTRNIELSVALTALLLAPAAYAEDEAVYAKLIET